MTTTPSDPIRFSVPHRAPADRKQKLGKGLGALLGETRREEPFVAPGTQTAGNDEADGQAGRGATSPLRSLPVSAIDPLPDNPRKHFDETALDELAASIAARGVIQPIIVRPRGERFELVAGERRWRAAQKARLHEVPALVRDLEDGDAVALALIENLQREDLNPIEEARAYVRLSEEQDMTQAEIASMVEKSRSHVANLQRLLALPEPVLDLVEADKLSMGHARALIGRNDALDLAKRAVADDLSVRDVEKLVRSLSREEGAENKPGSAPSAKTSAAREQNADIAAVERHLEEFLGLRVRIKADSDPRSGAITIRYGSLDQLDLVCQRLTGGDF